MAELYGLVSGAIERWRSKGLIDDGTAEALVAETREHAREGARAGSRYVIAAVAAVLVVIAAGKFVSEVFPLLTLDVQMLITAAAGLALHAAGVRIGLGERVRAVGQLMQIGGMWVLLVAAFNSQEIWAAGTWEGVLVGVASLAVALVSGPISVRQGEYVPALTLPFSFIFLWVFLDRALSLDLVTGLWILDVVMLVLMLVLVRRLLSGPGPEGERWVLFATTSAAYSTFALIVLTASEMQLGDEIFYPLDVWWGILVALSWAGWRGRVAGYETWYEGQLALLVIIGTVLTWATLGGTLGMDESIYSIWAGAGALAVIFFALRVESILMLGAASFCLAIDSWIWAVTSDESWSVVLALLFSAGLLFWVATRIGALRKAEDGPVDGADPVR